MTPSKLQISEKALEPMDELRMLLVEDGDVSISFHDDSCKYLSDNLSCFVWKNYRGKSLPPNFEPKGLVHLELTFSSLRRLWNGRKDFRYLRRLNLSRSRRLIKTPDFRGMPNLDLRECCDLEDVHPSLGNCAKLIRLDLFSCTSLKRFPCVNVKSLEYLCLEYCMNLEKFPEIIGSMKSELDIYIEWCGIRELPSSLFQYPTHHITTLDMSYLRNIVTLPNSICKSKSLKILIVLDCKQLESLPKEIGDLENLEELYACNTLISRPPPSIIHLNKLKILSFYKVKSKEGHFVFPQVNQGLRTLEELDLGLCNLIDEGLPEDIGCLSSLKKLYLSGNDFGRLPRSIAQLGALEFLSLSCCRKLRKLPELPPNLESLYLSDCRALEEVHHSLGNCSKLIWLDLFECTRLKRFPRVNVDSLKYLCLKGCESLEKFPEIIRTMKSELEIHMKDSGIRELPSSSFQGRLPRNIEVLDVSFCKSLRELPELLPNVLILKADSCLGPSIQNYQNVELLIFTEVEFDDAIGDLFEQTLLKCILSLRNAFSASDSLSQRVFKMWHSPTKIPNWLRYDATPRSLRLVKLPESWYANGTFLGFVICYYGSSDEIVVELIPSSNDDEPEKLSKRLAVLTMGKYGVNFYFIPLASLWDTSKANGKTPDAYGHLRFSLIHNSALEFGFRLLYKDDPELEALLEKLEHNHNHKRKFGEHHDSMTNEVSCSFSKKQVSHSNTRGSSMNLPQQEEGPSTSGLLQLFPENPGS